MTSANRTGRSTSLRFRAARSQADARLSQTAVIVLTAIAEGRSYDQILKAHPDLSYLDIFGAAREALEADQRQVSAHQAKVEAIRKTHPRAYEPWSEDEEATLVRLAKAGIAPEEIARLLQRQNGAITGRLVRMGLLERPAPEAASPVE